MHHYHPIARPGLRLLTSLALLALVLPRAAAASDDVELYQNPRSPGHPGGRLVAALTAEPRTLNPLAAVDRPSLTVIRRTMADLVHVDRRTQKAEPALAKSWTVSPDGRRFTLELRQGVRFSDGHPLDADDVVFTFAALLDEKVASPYRPLLVVGGEPIKVKKLDSQRLEFELASPYAVGVELFDSLAILPEHRLGAAWREGRLAEAWGTSTPPGEVVGLGPFRLKSYLPGERVTLERNPHYWKADAEGQRLPYLDELTFLFVANEDAQLIRFRSGDIDVVDRLSGDSFDLLESSPGASWTLHDLGPGLDFHFLFFNLNDLDSERLGEVARKQAWFKKRAFRQAVSAAIDRQGIARLVYKRRATPIASHVSPGNKRWSNEELEVKRRDVGTARRRLEEAGFSWYEDGRLVDSSGAPVSFSIVTNSSSEERVRMASIVQQDLRELGIGVEVAALEFRALVDRLLNTHDYEACLLGMTGGLDPIQFTNVWRSDGGNHLWRVARESPEEAWQKEVDQLLDRQLVEVDPVARKRLYDRVQTVLAAEEPVVLLVAPNVLVGASAKLGHFTPAILDHFTLWNADELYWLPDQGPPGER